VFGVKGVCVLFVLGVKRLWVLNALKQYTGG
jgi:hypothetical protein